MPDFPGAVYELQFNREAALVDPAQLDNLANHITTSAPTDLLVLSHGWNNDMAQARALYGRLRQSLAAQLPRFPNLAARHFTCVDVLWPSKKFADKDLIPGGAAAAGALVNDIIQEQLGALEALLEDEANPADFQRAKALVALLQEGNNRAQIEFAELVLKYLPRAKLEEGDYYDPGIISGKFGDRPLLEVLGLPAPLAPPDSRRGGAAAIRQDQPEPASRGGAAGLGDLLAGVKAGAINLLNLTTYYKMKERAGIIGQRGLNAALRRLTALPSSPKKHLVGHSFGGRVVTATVLGPEHQLAVPVASLTLLQAAYSHYGLARNYRKSGKDGFFRRVVDEKRVQGPILITHTRNDSAVGVQYAIASRLARQVAAALGDEHDQYGGMGGNGAQDTPESVKADLNSPGVAYQLQVGKVYNLKSDRFIANHSDVTNEAVTFAIWSAVSAA